jgi:ribonuclease D
VIHQEKQLAELLPRLRAAEWVALDTEADSLHAYPEKLCLIQLSLPGADALIDPLGRLSLKSFWEELVRHELILHGADYDLRMLHKRASFVPRSVFDTMIAARLLGFAHFGLADLVQRLLDVKLEKGPQKANWAIRPLTERMENYALNDTRHLKPLADLLRKELEAKGRLAWLSESCEWLIRDCIQPRGENPDAVWRVKGSSRLTPPALAVLREIWQWREHEAVAHNKPPFFVLSPDAMVHMAAESVNGQHIDDFVPPHFSPRRRSGVSAAIQRGLEVPRDQQPRIPRNHGRRVTDAEKQRFDVLKQKRDRKASELGIDPTLIASRATLEAVAHEDKRRETDLMRWQQELLA